MLLKKNKSLGYEGNILLLYTWTNEWTYTHTCMQAHFLSVCLSLVKVHINRLGFSWNKLQWCYLSIMKLMNTYFHWSIFYYPLLQCCMVITLWIKCLPGVRTVMYTNRFYIIQPVIINSKPNQRQRKTEGEKDNIIQNDLIYKITKHNVIRLKIRPN